MTHELSDPSFHPAGEQPPVEGKGLPQGVILDSFAGPVHVEWDTEAALTPLGQLPFFIDFLKAAGLFDAFVAWSTARRSCQFSDECARWRALFLLHRAPHAKTAHADRHYRRVCHRDRTERTSLDAAWFPSICIKRGAVQSKKAVRFSTALKCPRDAVAIIAPPP